VFLQYEEATFKIRKLESWSTGDYEKCAAAKNQMIESLEEQIPMDSWRDQWLIAPALLTWLQEERAKRTIASVTRRKAWLALEQPPENTEDAKDVKDPAYAWEDEDDVLGS